MKKYINIKSLFITACFLLHGCTKKSPPHTFGGEKQLENMVFKEWRDFPNESQILNIPIHARQSFNLFVKRSKPEHKTSNEWGRNTNLTKSEKYESTHYITWISDSESYTLLFNVQENKELLSLEYVGYSIKTQEN